MGRRINIAPADLYLESENSRSKYKRGRQKEKVVNDQSEALELCNHPDMAPRLSEPRTHGWGIE